MPVAAAIVLVTGVGWGKARLIHLHPIFRNGINHIQGVGMQGRDENLLRGSKFHLLRRIQNTDMVGNFTRKHQIMGDAQNAFILQPVKGIHHQGNTLFVHILNLKDKGLFLPITDKKIKQATLFKNGEKVRFQQDKEGVLLRLAEVPTDIDYVVRLDF